jgi:hypothetical protein
MNKLNFIWRDKPEQFASGQRLYINKINVAQYEYNGSMSKKDTDEYKSAHRYSGKTDLPSMTQLVYESSDELIRAKLERMVTVCFNEALKDEAK